MAAVMDALNLVWITLLPFLELRASIPFGILKTELHWLWVFVICVIANIVIGIILFFIIGFMVRLLTRIKFIDRLYQARIMRLQKKLHPLIEKYGDWALAIFIGIPAPGTGVYSGALAAYLLGMDFRKFIWANAVGVLIAGVIVTAVTLSGVGIFQFFVKAV
ncbi:small multi-drug export protein [Candidatus Woesearchaeota archaeon]|nr:small multi-drug export protein [Candidatus Woesearchaeota archaeon]